MAQPSSFRNLVFCFPYRHVGGVPLLFLRLAEYLEEKALLPHVSIHLVDYSDGYMAKHLKNARVSVIEYRDDEPCTIPQDSLVVFQSMTPWSIFPTLRLPDATRILFWNCFPFNLIPPLPGFREWFFRQEPRTIRLILNTVMLPFVTRMRRFTAEIHSKKGLVFMDGANFLTTTALLGLSLPDAAYVPIGMASATAKPADSAVTEKRPLRLAWIGRLADFKIFSLVRVLSDLQHCLATSPGEKIDFFVIGDGPMADRLAAFQSDGPLRLHLLGSLSPNRLTQILSEGLDGVFAMGTSALESARWGLPTLLLDVSYGAISERYRYRFLFESERYSVGDVIHPGNYPKGAEMARILNALHTDGPALGARCRNYFEANHSLAQVSARFLDALRATQLTWGHLAGKRMLEKPLPYRGLQLLRRARLA